MQGAVTVRFIGADDRRRFLVQRQDGKLWTGRRWTREVPEARLYVRLRDAQAVCNGMLRRRHRGKEVRRFRCQMTISVIGDGPCGLDDLRDYLREALQLNLDVAAHGDGPGGNWVTITACLSGLEPASTPEGV
jgi:hypothetical protein